MTSRSTCLALLLLALTACEREERELRPRSEGEAPIVIALSSIAPGQQQAIAVAPDKSRYQFKAYQLSQGKTFYAWFNCNGCHANGGGGSGPPLMDDKWIYGARIENIVATIREGRPNGMPSFRGKIPDDQIWQIAAYVRSMSGNVPSDAAPGRNDTMHAKPAENREPERQPVSGGSGPPPQ
jgi:cytochrome c oxidase cbb3-type subunit 3